MISQFAIDGFPHSRGDVPAGAGTSNANTSFSPLTWGCSGAGRYCAGREFVFPTHVGMFLGGDAAISAIAGFPHSRGDVPPTSPRSKPPTPFSPLTWGCSSPAMSPKFAHAVFPTHVGMFRLRGLRRRRRRGFPHSRGDVPSARGASGIRAKFSPLTWGCSDNGRAER